jgi:hypothetical protein
MPQTLLKLQEASAGLLMPSESDYPFEVFVAPAGSSLPLPSPVLLSWIHRSADTAVEGVNLPYFFRNVTRERPEHGESEREAVRRFRHLQQVLEQELADVRVYRVGSIRIDAYILGRTSEAQIAGLKTTLIET